MLLPQPCPHAPQLSKSCLKSTHPPLQAEKPARHTQLPPEQVSRLAQAVLQVPHSRGVFCKVVQALGCAQVVTEHTHWLFWQVAPGAHWVPHPPQLFTSLLVGMHMPLQDDEPGAQPHAPLLQDRPGGQTLPQVPQLASSVLSFLHPAPSQYFSAPGHAHFPCAHPVPMHTLPQAPQLPASVLTSTQLDPHIIWPLPHPVHMPCVQPFPGAQA